MARSNPNTQPAAPPTPETRDHGTLRATLRVMPTRWVHFRVDEQIYERIRSAATADRRSLSNWVAVACERALSAESDQDQVEPAR